MSKSVPNYDLKHTLIMYFCILLYFLNDRAFLAKSNFHRKSLFIYFYSIAPALSKNQIVSFSYR